MAEVFWHNLAVGETVKLLRTDAEKGLTDNKALVRQREFGENKLPEEKPLPRLKIFVGQFKSPLIYILLIAGLITLILKEYADAIVILGAVFLNSTFGFFQENKASKALIALKKIVRRAAEVKRDGRLKIIESEDLAPGDLIILNPGDKVPADARVTKSNNLKINEMVLTGEWLPAKKITDVLNEKTPLADRDNMVYMGTVVEEGRGEAIVAQIGQNTELGKIVGTLKETKEEKTPYQKKLSHFSKIIGLVIGFISLGIFIEGILTGGTFLEMFTIAVAVAVASIPEGLPVAMTVILALGMQRILKKQGLVRKLVSAETLGSTSIIVTDKTATLTEGTMKVADIFSSDEKGANLLCQKAATLTSEAFVENPDDPKENWLIRGRPTDKALLEAGIEAGINHKREFEKEKIAEITFNPIRKFSAVLLKENGRKILYVAGVPEKILGLSNLAEKEKENWLAKLEELAQKGLRVVATAYRKILENGSLPIDSLCDNLTFTGFIALKDPIRPEAKEAIKICRQAGLRLIIATGDHKLTAKAVAQELDFDADISQEHILEGKDLDGLSDKDFNRILDRVKIYARVEPRHKMRIVEAWQKRGEVVAMAGDGINDAPALKKADIGIALGSGTEVAKETSDLVLLDDSFSIIVAAIEEGRGILDNIRKVITYLLSDSFTEIILIGGSILISWLTGQPWILPILAGQILWVNLIEDGPLSLALAFEPKEKDVMRQKPQNHNQSLLTREMKVLIFIIGLITNFLLLGLFFWLLKFSNYEISHIRSIIFAGLAIGSIFYIFSCRSLRKNLWQVNPFSNIYLIFIWLASFLLLLAALYLPPIQALLKTQPLTFFDWQLILGLGVLNIFLIEVTKWYFIAKAKISKNAQFI